MSLTCSIQPRGVTAILVASTLTTLAATTALIVTVVAKQEPCTCAPVVATQQPIIVEGPNLQYASTVRAFSSQYSNVSWSALEALGPPNVYPRAGDIEQAWASREPDSAIEFIELGFAQPQRASALLVYETYNPGAIESIELITESGKRLTIARTKLERSGGSALSTFGTTCSSERIVATRITVGSGNVAGWNEIDAVALMPCQ